MSLAMGGTLVLGIETSSPRCSVALLNELEVISQREVPLEGSRRASALIEVADAMFHAASISPQQLQLVAVSIGPGSFTGLRIGVTFGKTLAYAVGCMVAGVNSLHVIAESVDAAAPHSQELHVIADAQRGEVFHQPFRRCLHDSAAGSGIPAWTEAGVRQIVRPAALAANVTAGATLAGPGIERHRDELLRSGMHLDLIPCEPTAVSVARLGVSFTGQHRDPWTLLPDYGRPSSAEEKREQARV